MKTKQLLWMVLLLSSNLFFFSCKKPITEPSSETSLKVATRMTTNALTPLSVGDSIQEFNEVLNGFDENKRAGLGGTWSDFSPTGYYLLPGDTVKLVVTQLAGSTLPKLLIGTYSRDTTRLDPRTVSLAAGLNTITDNVGGMLWIRYITAGTPTAKVRITIKSGAVRVPVFFKNQTTDWAAQLASYSQAPDALLINDNVYLVWTRSRASNMTETDANFVLQKIDLGINQGENYISGFDGSTADHLPPVHKILGVESNKPGVWGAATWYRILFAPGFIDEGISAATIVNSGWGVWHEIGHMHQQPAWTWSGLGEVTVNIYTLAAERAIGGNGVNRLKGSITNNALSYLASTDPNKNFNATSGTINDPFVRLMMFHQLWLAFGDSFYINLHKQSRIEKPAFGNTDDPANNAVRMRYFMLKACNISGKDLSYFFRKWALPVAQSVYDEIAALNLPVPTVDPTTLTDENTAGIENGARYKIISLVNNSSLLDLNGSNTTNGAIVSLWSNNNPTTNNQVWRLKRSSTPGKYYIQSEADTAKVLNVRGAATANGTQIEIWQNTGSSAQEWKITPVAGGNFTLEPTNAPGKNLDIAGSGTANGTKVEIYTAGSSNNQKFKLVKQ